MTQINSTPIKSADCWLTTEEELACIAQADRFAEVSIRYRGASEGRFTAKAQYVADLVSMLEATGRYVRDMRVAGSYSHHIIKGAFNL